MWRKSRSRFSNWYNSIFVIESRKIYLFLYIFIGCSCANVYDPKFDCKGNYECNGGAEVFAWGSNLKG